MRHAAYKSASSFRIPHSAFRIQSAGEDGDDLVQHRFSPLAQLLTGQMRDRMRGEDQRKIRRAPHVGHRPRGVDKNVGTNRDRRNAGLFHMDAIVHTARAARASTDNGDDDVIARRRHGLDGRRVSRFGRRRFAVVLDMDDTEALPQDGLDLL